MNKAKSPQRHTQLFLVENLEQRILLSADPVVAELVQQYHDANAENLGALQVNELNTTDTNLLKQTSQENAAFNLDLANAQDFALNTINVADFSKFETENGIVIGNENSNAIINLGDAKTDNGKLTFNQNLLISNPQAGGEIFVDDDLIGGANADLTINGSGHTTILSANISTTNTNITVNDSLKIDGTRAIIAGTAGTGGIQLGSASNHAIDGHTSGGSLALNAKSGGNIVVKGIIGGSKPLTSLKVRNLDPATWIVSASDLAGALNVTFDSEVTVAGDVEIYASGTVTFKSALNITNGGNLTIRGADLIVFENNVVVSGDVFLEGNEITLNGGQESLRTTGANKTLTMRPTNLTYDISLASPPAEQTESTLNLSSTEIFTIGTSFSKVVIGHETSSHADPTFTGTVYIGSKAANQNTFFSPVEIYGKAIDVKDFFNPDLKFQTKDTLILDAISDITIYNEVKAFDGSANKNITLYSRDGKIAQSANPDDNLSRESITANTLTINAETGIDLGFVTATSISATNDDLTKDIIVNSVAPTTTTTTFTTVLPRSSGKITLSSDVNSLVITPALTTTTGNITVQAGKLTTAGTTVLPSTGALTISSTVTTTTGAITLESYGDLTLNGLISTTGSSALSFKSTAGKIWQNVDITSDAGSAITLTAGDSIEMLDGKKIQTTGTIILTAGTNVKLSILNSTTTVNVTATAGAISDNLTGEAANILGTTTTVSLTAKTGIGASGTADINTTIATLTARNGATEGAAGGIFINETDALTISNAGIKQEGGTGSIVITNATDTAITVNGEVNNTGSGHVLIQAQDALLINALVKSVAGNISLLSLTDALTFNANGGIETTGTTSSVDVEAALAITMTSGSTIKGGGGNVRLNAKSGNIALSYLDAKTGKVSLLTTNAYRILDNDTSDDIDIISGSLRMNSHSVGQDNSGVINHLEIDSTNLSVYTVGSLFLTEATGLTVKTIDAITVKRVNVDGSTLTDQTDAAQSDLTSVSGSIVLTATTGDLIIQDGNANNQGVLALASSAGNILINAVTGNLRLEAPVTSGSGHINLLSGATLTQTAEGDVKTISGTIDVNAATAIVMADGATTLTTNQSIRYKTTTGDITIGYLGTYGDDTASIGDIAIVAGGKIIDADSTGFDIRAKTLYLAGTGIGTGENPLEITVETIAAKADAGGIFLSQSAAITVDSVSTTVYRIGIDGAVASSQVQSGSDLITTGNGAIVLSATDIVLKDGDANGKVVSGQGSGNILLNASTGNLTFYGSLTSTTGNVSLLASQNILLNSASQFFTGFPASTATSGYPSMDIEAGQMISMVNGAQIQTGNGNMRLAANGGNLTLGMISAGTGNISLISTGKILDTNENGMDIVAKDLRIYASDVGLNINPLEVNVSNLSTIVFGNAGLFLNEADNITVSKIDDLTVNRVDSKAAISAKTDLTQSDLVSLGNGSLILSAPAGSITVLDGNDDGKGIEIKNKGQLLLDALDTIALESSVLTNEGNVSFLSSKRIVQTTEADVITGGTIDYNAMTTITIEDGANISTQGANIRLSAGDTLTFSGIDAREGSVSLSAKTLLDAGDTTFDVKAKNLRINAVVGIGISTNLLEINVANLTASASTGGMFLNEYDGVTVTTLPDIIINRVSLIGETSGIADPSQSNLSTSTGAIILTTTTGDITVLEGKVVGKGIITQSGNVLLNTAGNINLQAAIETINSPIQLIAGDTLSQLGNGNLFAGGTIDVLAKNAIVMNAGTLAKTSGNKDIRYETTTGDMTIALIDAGKGNVALLSGAKILDNLKTTTGAVMATGVNLIAANAIGLGGENANPFEINVSKLTAKTGSAGAFMTNLNPVAVDLVSVSTQTVDSAGVATTREILTESDLKSLNSGSIILNAPQITLQDGDKDGKAIALDGKGNLLLKASSAGIDVNAAINADSGNISLLTTNDNSKILVNANITTSSSGTIDLEARSDIVLAKDIKISADGNIRLTSGENLTLSNVTSLDSVSLMGNKILNGNDSINNVSANELRINAGSLGSSQNPFTTNVNAVSVNLTKDGLFLTQEAALTVTQIADIKINRIETNGSITSVIDKKQSDIVVENGAVVLTNKSGDITVTDGDTNGKGIVVKQGNLSLSAAKNLAVQTGIENVAGNITLSNQVGNITLSNGDKEGKAILLGKGNLSLSAAENLTIQAGIENTAGNVIISNNAGNITLNNGDKQGNAIVLKKGNLLLSAAENVTIQAGIENAAGNISLNAGAFLTQSDKGNITGNGTIDVNATTGITMSDEVSTKTQEQNLRYKSDGDINLSVLNAGAGNIAVISGANITNVSKTGKVNLLADSLNINAKAIGNAEMPLNVTLKKIAASTGAGGFFVSSASDLSIDQVNPFNINQVQTNGLTRVEKTKVLRGITTSENGSLVLSANNLTMSSTTTQSDKNIFVNGTGNLLLTAKGNINLLSGITVQKGAMTLVSEGTIYQPVKGKLTLSGGSLSLQAKEIIQAQSTKTQTSNGNIKLNAEVITLGSINAGKGDVSLIASKRVLDLGKSVSIIANQLKISAGAAGEGKNPLDVKINVLSAEVGEGGLFINTANPLAISETTAISIDSVLNTGVTQKIVDAPQVGLTSSQNGAMIISVQGNLNVLKNVNADGNLLLESRTRSLNIQAKIQVEKGAMSLASNTDLKIGDVQISNTQGTIDVRSKKNLLMSDAATLQTQDAMILLTAKDKLQVTGIDAGSSLVTLNANTITDAGDKNIDVVAEALDLKTKRGVGIRSNSLDIDVNRLSARIDKNTLFINELNSLQLDATPVMNVTRIATNGTESKISDSTKKMGIVLLSDSSISLLATSDITINSRIKSPNAGSITLQSATGAIFQNATVETSGGLKLLAPKGVTKSASLAKIIAPLNSDLTTLATVSKPLFYAWTESVSL